MGLSAQERRQWRELERQLTVESPQPGRKLESTLDGSLSPAHRRAMTARTVLALVVVLVAFMIVVLAAIVKIPLIGVLGFVLMIIGGTRLQPLGTRSPAHQSMIPATSQNS